jgi:3-methyladenine DNA glycosylase Tag
LLIDCKQYSEDDITRLLDCPGIVRDKAKIKVAIHNAGYVIALVVSDSSVRWKGVFAGAETI